MEYINHVTLNTMDVRKTYPSEVNKDIYFILKRIVDEAKKNKYVEVLDDTYLSLTIENQDIYAATLLHEKQFPVLTSYGVRKKEDMDYVWDVATGLYKKITADNIERIPVQNPAIIDVLYPIVNVPFEIFSWTGDFTRCLGWILMDPDSIMK